MLPLELLDDPANGSRLNHQVVDLLLIQAPMVTATATETAILVTAIPAMGITVHFIAMDIQPIAQIHQVYRLALRQISLLVKQLPMDV